MKKFLAILLALVMVLALAACNNDGGKESTPASGSGTSTPGGTSEPTTSEPGETEPPKPADPEPLPAEALNHWDFESADGLTAVYQVIKPADIELTAGNLKYDIVDSKHEVEFADGPVGKAAYLDGNYGIKLDMKAPTDDSYTIAFWYNGARFFTFGPIVTMGRNIGMADSADPASAVAWFNFCQSEWGADSTAPQLVPTVWNRNSSIGTDISAGGVWPWVAGDTVYGKKEWAHVAIVVDGVRYTADDGMERIGAKLYINGVLMFDANSENLFYQGVAPEVFQHLDTAIRGLEAYIGVNYWDDAYKGFIDDMYVYDEALTAGQITSLYQLGDPTVASTAPEYNGPTDEEQPEPTTPALPEITPDANAIDVLGTPDRTLGFFTDNSASYALEEGKTVTMTLNNYSNAANNWSNFLVGFCANEFTTDQHASGDAAVCTVDGYTEYGVQRADAYGWGPAGSAFAQTSTTSWTDWAAWLNLMTNAKVTLKMTRAADVITMDYTFTGADGTVMTEQSVVTLGVAADAPIYAFIDGEGAYIELLSVVTE